MQRLYQARDLTEATLLAELLREENIAAQVLGAGLGGMVGGVPVVGATEVWVPDEQLDAAHERLEPLLNQLKPAPAVNPKKCRECGYDLRGLPEPRCPECGTPFQRQDKWTCPECGEEHRGQFTSCWNCGTEKP